jgi:hypothetical protein
VVLLLFETKGPSGRMGANETKDSSWAYVEFALYRLAEKEVQQNGI